MDKRINSIYDLAYTYYLDGLSLQQVAKKIGVTRQCVYEAFVKRKFKIRKINYRPYCIYDGIKFTLRNTGYYSSTTKKRCLLHRYIWEKEKYKIPDGYDIHHIDGDKTNNSIDNLECLSKSEHTRLYSPHHNQYTKSK